MLTLERRDSFDTYTLEQPQIPKNNFDLLRLLLALNVCLCHLGEDILSPESYLQLHAGRGLFLCNQRLSHFQKL